MSCKADGFEEPVTAGLFVECRQGVATEAAGALNFSLKACVCQRFLPALFIDARAFFPYTR